MFKIRPLKWPYLFFYLISLFSVLSCNRRPETFNFTIIHSADLNGELEPCGCMYNPLGGLAYRGTIINRIKKESDKLLMFDSGDMLFHYHNMPISYEKKRLSVYKKNAKTIIKIMNHWGLYAATFGETDIGAGYEEWVKLQKKASYPVVSINAKDEDGIIKPYIIKKFGGIKILITGVTGKTFVSPLIISDKIKVVKYEEPLKKLLSKIKADFVIVLSHSGYVMDLDIARTIRGIDLILGGHSTRNKVVEKKNGIYIVHNGEKGKNISRIDITMKFDKKTDTYSKAIKTEIIEIDPKITPDKKIIKILTKE